jgi:hypothetical protein
MANPVKFVRNLTLYDNGPRVRKVLEEIVLRLLDCISIVIETTLAKISPVTDSKQVRVIIDKASASGVQICI